MHNLNDSSKLISEDFPIQLAICIIVKNEGEYIKEWLDYHILAGVGKFFIYDNESEDDIKSILTPYIEKKLVDYSYWPGKAQQMNAYNDAIKKHRLDCKYMGFIDADEFIVPLNTHDEIHKVLQTILSIDQQACGVAINWRYFGDSGKMTKPEGGVLKNFLYCGKRTDKHVKIIVNPRLIESMVTPHHGKYLNGHYIIDERGIKVTSPFNLNADPQFIRINHYYSKSKEEFFARRSLLRASTGTERHNCTEDGYASFNTVSNEIYDDEILKYKAMRENMKGRDAKNMENKSTIVIPEKAYPIALSKNEIEFLVDAIKDSKRYLEFGSGGSTFITLERTNVQEVISVESDNAWLDKLREWSNIRTNEGGRLRFIHVDIGKTGSLGFPVSKDKQESYFHYSADPFTQFQDFDSVFIDGRFRVACALQTALHCGSTSKILFHDFNNRKPYHCILKFFDILDTMDTMALLKVKENIDRKEVLKMWEKHKYDPS